MGKNVPTKPTPGPKGPPKDPYEDFGQGVVDAIDYLRERLVDLRQQIALEPGRDATAAAGHIARAILARGGALPGNNPHALRWTLNEAPSPAADPDGTHATKHLVALILDALASKTADNGELAKAAEHWPNALNKGEGDKAVAAAKAAEGEARAAEHRAAHDARMAAVSRDPGAAKRERQARANAYEAEVKTQREQANARLKARGIAPNAEGEWIEGDTFDIPDGIEPRGEGGTVG